MSRESQYQAIILKKQPFGEADEIITFYTREVGKVRGLAKSVKLATSKLQSSLQLLFLTRITLTKSSSLPKVIHVGVEEVFANLRDNYERIALSFVASELIVKATADEQKNEVLFESFLNLLHLLDLSDITVMAAQAGLCKFKIELAEFSGMGIHRPSATAGEPIKFSTSGGGFYTGPETADSRSVSQSTFDQFLRLQATPYTALMAWDEDTSDLRALLTAFLTYQLEREIKSERYLKGVV